METNSNVEVSAWHTQWLDNGIVVSQPDYDVLECEKFSNNGKYDDEAMIRFFGRMLWENFKNASDSLLQNSLKITIKIEKDD